MRKVVTILAIVLGMPLICTMFIKPDKENWKKLESDTSVINEKFLVIVKEGTGNFAYKPEELTALMMYCLIPDTITFSSSEDYIAEGSGAAHDPEQEYLKALAVVCRTDIAYIWEKEACPDRLDFDKMELSLSNFSSIYADVVADVNNQNKMNEIRNAVGTTMGAVITKEDRVIAAPFFTTSDADMLVGESGDGTGLSLNYAYELATQGMDFYEILKYFFAEIKIVMYE